MFNCRWTLIPCDIKEKFIVEEAVSFFSSDLAASENCNFWGFHPFILSSIVAFVFNTIAPIHFGAEPEASRRAVEVATPKLVGEDQLIVLCV